MLYIGIDTGVNTGFAVWDTKKQAFYEVKAIKIHQAMDQVKQLRETHGDSLVVRVEDPRQRTWFGTERMTREQEHKKLQGVGSVKRDATIWEDFLDELDVRYEMVAPKHNRTKLTQETFKSYTGWVKQTNEHGRDAAMLVFGF